MRRWLHIEAGPALTIAKDASAVHPVRDREVEYASLKASHPSLRLYLCTPGNERTEIKLREAIQLRLALDPTT